MMDHEVVIQAENICKDYRIGVINHGMLYRDLQSWWARLLGKPDPNSEVGNPRLHKLDNSRLNGDIFSALKDVNFEIQKGEIVGVVGRNGAGKSTLLKVISRITAPTRGRIRLKGRVASLLEVGTGFHPELTGRENVFLNGAILGMTRGEISRKFDQIVEFAEISEYIDTPVKRYSSGMYVRLAFSVAAHLEPEILLIDEVLAVGDINFQKKCLGRMQQLGRDGRTVLFVSHNLASVQQLCSKSMLVDDGRVVKMGPTKEIIQDYVSCFSENYPSLYVRKKTTEYGPATILRLAACKPDSTPSSQLELTEEIQIEIEYYLKSPLAGLSVGLQIILDDGLVTLISLSDPEFAPERLERRERGRYRSTVSIPRGILNTGRYRLRAGISSRFTVYDVVENVVFEVVDNFGVVQFMGWDRKGSLLALQLPWQVHCLGEID